MTQISKVYAPLFKGWQVKVMGAKPADDLLATAHAFGRPGKQSLALAMAMRPEGVSGAQIVMACGAPQNNHRRGLIAGGQFKRDMSVPPNEQGHTVYRVTLTAKGEAAMKRKAEAEAKAALTGDVPASGKAKARKAAGKGKGRKVKAPATTPAAPVNDGTTAPAQGNDGQGTAEQQASS